jgi:hypothetical protein
MPLNSKLIKTIKHNIYIFKKEEAEAAISLEEWEWLASHPKGGPPA